MTKTAEDSCQVFLKLNNPGVKMLGILANFGKYNNYQAVKLIIEGINSYSEGDFAKSRYFKQLRIFLQLRKHVEQQFDKVMQSVSTFFKEENDLYYRKGEAKGKLRGEELKSREVVEKLILKRGFTNEEAADIAGIDLAEVIEIRAELNTK